MGDEVTLKELVCTAIGAEKYSFEFYLRAKEVASSGRARKTFEQLAFDELHHFIILIERFGRQMMPEIALAIEKKGVDFPNAPRARRLVKKARAELDALKLGMERERIAVEFYQSGMTKVQDATLKEVFSELVEFEQGHYKILEAEFLHLSRVPIEAEVHTYHRE